MLPNVLRGDLIRTELSGQAWSSASVFVLEEDILTIWFTVTRVHP
jgi:hypothetical protein